MWASAARLKFLSAVLFPPNTHTHTDTHKELKCSINTPVIWLRTRLCLFVCVLVVLDLRNRYLTTSFVIHNVPWWHYSIFVVICNSVGLKQSNIVLGEQNARPLWCWFDLTLNGFKCENRQWNGSFHMFFILWMAIWKSISSCGLIFFRLT